MKHINTSLTVFVTLTLFGLTLSAPQFFRAKAMGFASPASTTTMVGTVSCAACRGTCPKKAETLYSCTLRNVRAGSPYVLVVGDQLYTLTGNTAALERFAGGKAAVQGQVEGSNILVESASDAKSAARR